MFSLVRGFALLALVFLLSDPIWLAAQDKKDPPPDKKKDTDPFKLKKTDPKKDKDKTPTKEKEIDWPQDPKDPFGCKNPANKPETGKPPLEDFPYHHNSVECKIRRISGANQDVFTIQITKVDPVKVAKFQEWQTKQLLEISKAQNQRELAERQTNYLKDLPARQADIYTSKEHDVKASEKIKVRTIDPPQEFDDKGFQKKWTTKELAILKGNTKMPGYPAAVEAVRVDQIVQVYLLPPPKSMEQKRLNDDDPPAPKALPEVVLIIVAPQMR